MSNLMGELLEIKEQPLTNFQKAKSALVVTKRHRVLRPVMKKILKELKRIGWDDRSKNARYGIGVGGIALLLFGGQGAGIAALGGGIGVPLWIVLGAGATSAGVLQDELSGNKTIKAQHSVIESEKTN